MSDSKHTPGPWAQYAQNALIIVGKDGASLGDMTPGDPYISNEEALSNAKLVVCAPDLLAALKRSEQYLILAVHDNEGSLRMIAEKDLGFVRAAIAKAAP